MASGILQAASNLSGSADHPGTAETAGFRKYLFLDLEPEAHNPAAGTRSGLPLMAWQNNAKMLRIDGET